MVGISFFDMHTHKRCGQQLADGQVKWKSERHAGWEARFRNESKTMLRHHARVSSKRTKSQRFHWIVSEKRIFKHPRRRGVQKIRIGVPTEHGNHQKTWFPSSTGIVYLIFWTPLARERLPRKLHPATIASKLCFWDIKHSNMSLEVLTKCITWRIHINNDKIIMFKMRVKPLLGERFLKTQEAEHKD